MTPKKIVNILELILRKIKAFFGFKKIGGADQKSQKSEHSPIIRSNNPLLTSIVKEIPSVVVTNSYINPSSSSDLISNKNKSHGLVEESSFALAAEILCNLFFPVLFLSSTSYTSTVKEMPSVVVTNSYINHPSDLISNKNKSPGLVESFALLAAEILCNLFFPVFLSLSLTTFTIAISTLPLFQKLTLQLTTQQLIPKPHDHFYSQSLILADSPFQPHTIKWRQPYCISETLSMGTLSKETVLLCPSLHSSDIIPQNHSYSRRLFLFGSAYLSHLLLTNFLSHKPSQDYCKTLNTLVYKGNTGRDTLPTGNSIWQYIQQYLSSVCYNIPTHNFSILSIIVMLKLNSACRIFE